MKAIVCNNFKKQFQSLNKYLNLEVIDYKIIRFNNGDSKIVIESDLSKEEVIIFSNFNTRVEYKYLNEKRYYSSDEYYVELIRLISAIKAKKISVYLPFIYECRQNNDKENESKDFSVFIRVLKSLNVEKIITFEIHGENKEVKSYSLSLLFKDSKYDVVVSPDKGGVKRSLEYSKIISCDNYYFTKERNLNQFKDGYNPISSYKGENYNFKDKEVLIVDDILDSGNTLVKALSKIKGAKKVDIFVCYGLFSKGVSEFRKLVKEKKLNKIYVSNLIEIRKEIKKENFIEVIDCDLVVSKYLKGELK